MSGWWFPNHDYACLTLGLSKTQLKGRKRRGKAGDIMRRTLSDVLPAYYKGFWFPSIKFAASILNKEQSAIRDYSNRHSGLPNDYVQP